MTYTTSRAKHGTDYMYRKGCRCEVCKSEKNRRMREYTQRRKERDGITPTAALKRARRGVDPLAAIGCFMCKSPLTNMRSTHARYPLHKACRESAPEWVRRGLDNPRRAEFQAKIDRAAGGTSGGGRVWTAGDCSWCAESFVGLSHYCSTRCRTAAKFARRSSGQSFNIPPRDRLKIYERDAWICQLCDHPVDSNLRHPHIWSATLDHIVPQSQMLIPDHSPSNLRLAHMWCNSARGDGSNMTETEFLERVAAHFDGALAA